jgi:hypothetical protein
MCCLATSIFGRWSADSWRARTHVRGRVCGFWVTRAVQAGARSRPGVVRRVGRRFEVDVLKKVVEQFSLPCTNDYFLFDSFTYHINF